MLKWLALLLCALCAGEPATAALTVIDRTISMTGLGTQTFEVWNDEWGVIAHIDQVYVEFTMPFEVTFSDVSPIDAARVLVGPSGAYTIGLPNGTGFGSSLQFHQDMSVAGGDLTVTGEAFGGIIGQGGLLSNDYTSLLFTVGLDLFGAGPPYAMLFEYPSDDAVVYNGAPTFGPINTRATFTISYEASGVPIPPDAVPEPRTWAMMLIGFGLMGWRLRSKHQQRPIGETARNRVSLKVGICQLKPCP